MDEHLLYMTGLLVELYIFCRIQHETNQEGMYTFTKNKWKYFGIES